jgi:Tol biopolymer transport system component
MATEGHIQRLWIRALDQSTATVLPGTEDGRSPFWSPDGKSIGFFAEGSLKRLDLAGGLPRVLCDHASNGGAWSPDGTIILGKVLAPIARVAAGGGSCTDVTHLESAQVIHSHPQFLPDGVRFVFRAQSGNFGNASGSLYLQSLNGGMVTKILDDVDSAARFAPPDSLLAVPSRVRSGCRGPTMPCRRTVSVSFSRKLRARRLRR